MADEITDPPGNQDIVLVFLKILAGCKVRVLFYFIYLERATVEAIAMMVRSVCPRIRLACRRG